MTAEEENPDAPSTLVCSDLCLCKVGCDPAPVVNLSMVLTQLLSFWLTVNEQSVDEQPVTEQPVDERRCGCPVTV